MGLLSKKAFTAEVVLSGVEAYATKASVRLNGAPVATTSDPRDVVAFVPMMIVSVMRGCRNDPPVAGPYVAVCGETARLLIDIGRESARTLRLRDLANPDLALERPGDDAAQILAAGVPEVTEELGPAPHRKFRADLKLGKRADATPFVQIHSHNATVAAIGTIAIFEHIARTEDYDSVTRPMSGAIIRVLEWAEKLGASPIPDFSQATVLYAIADRLALEDDPLNFDPDVAGDAG